MSCTNDAITHVVLDKFDFFIIFEWIWTKLIREAFWILMTMWKHISTSLTDAIAMIKLNFKQFFDVLQLFRIQLYWLAHLISAV